MAVIVMYVLIHPAISYMYSPFVYIVVLKSRYKFWPAVHETGQSTVLSDKHELVIEDVMFLCQTKNNGA